MGLEAGDVAITRDPRGVPWASVDGRRIPLSLSHADGWAAAAAHLRRCVGIDVEPARELPPRFSRYFLSGDEETAVDGWEDPSTSLLAAWTVKEAVLKATGRGLSVPPSRVVIRSMGAQGVTATVDGRDVGAACWREEDSVVAVACAGTRDLPELSISRGAM
jgi:4'-phosphopantetheinyl transferase